MRSICKGTVSFGMVAIPIKLYGATDDKRIAMNQLHTECGSRIKMPRYCPKCDRHLEAGEIVKGYPIDKDHYVPVTPEELENLSLNSLKSIQVDAFVKGVEDPRYFKASYLLSPEEVGAKAFVLFVKAMEQAGVMGIAKISIRDKEQLCSLQPFNGVLLLQTLHWSDELRDYQEIVPYATVSDNEMEMAGKLIGGMTRDVDLADYHDEYRQALVELISAKLEGKTIEAPIAPKRQDKDLADQLLASLNAMEPAGIKS